MKVRLKHRILVRCSVCRVCFNSMKVRLKRFTPSLRAMVIQCFNSMKVRLKRDVQGSFRIITEFQFHEGPIKTAIFKRMTFYRSLFQFHEGPIKTKFQPDGSDTVYVVSIP